MKSRDVLFESTDKLFKLPNNNKFNINLGNLKIYLIFIQNKNGYESIIIWSHYTPEIIMSQFSRKYGNYLDDPSKYELVKLDKEKFNEAAKNNYMNWDEIMSMCFELNETQPISEQIPNFRINDDSFVDGEDIICICDIKSIKKKKLNVCSNNSLLSLKSVSVEKFSNIKKKMEKNINAKELPWDTVSFDDNLVNLPSLTEDILLTKLRDRYRCGRFYTYIDKILVFLNPFCYIPLYNPRYSNKYRNHVPEKCPPHIFAIADYVYYKMLLTKHPQCIIISGESGSGKSEATKQLIHHFTYLSQYGESSSLVTAVLASSHVLEAFGNAYTSQNNNSSRFGKFTEILFEPNGTIYGARLKKYLLEKSRIVNHEPTEQNYHVFYYLVNGTDVAYRELLDLEPLENYSYLLPKLSKTRENQEDSFEFKLLKSSLIDLNIGEEIQHEIFSILSAILLIGNIKSQELSCIDDIDKLPIDPYLIRASKLLNINPVEFNKTLSLQQHFIRTEEIKVPLSTSRMKVVRDTLSKLLYSSLFEWIVEKINTTMRAYRKVDISNVISLRIMDIFGFENNKENSFEQFCINYANETLQMYLSQHTFKIQQDEYEEEGIEWKRIPYLDNSLCVQLFSSKTKGLLRLLEDECLLNTGTDASVLERYCNVHKDNKLFSVLNLKPDHFLIKHYAANVVYKIEGFREKNQNYVQQNILDLLEGSKCKLLRGLIDSKPPIMLWRKLRIIFHAIIMFSNIKSKKKVSSLSTQQNSLNTNYDITNNLNIIDLNHEKPIGSVMEYVQGVERKYPSSPDNSGTKQSPWYRRNSLITSLFQNSLNSLMDILSSSEAHFVRCIRSNIDLKPLAFDANTVLTQLRYTGLVQTIFIRQAGFSYRFLKQDFYEKFKIIFLKLKTTDFEEIFRCYNISSESYFVGKTKIFIQESVKSQLLQEIGTIITHTAETIQIYSKLFLGLLKIKHQVKNALIITIFLKTIKCINEYKNSKLNTLPSTDEATVNVYIHSSFSSKNTASSKSTVSVDYPSSPCNSPIIIFPARSENEISIHAMEDKEELGEELGEEMSSSFQTDAVYEILCADKYNDKLCKDDSTETETTENELLEFNLHSDIYKSHSTINSKKIHRPISSGSTNSVAANTWNTYGSSRRSTKAKKNSALPIFKKSTSVLIPNRTKPIISNIFQLYSYYDFLCKKIPIIVSKEHIKNIESKDTQFIVEDTFLKCLAKHGAFIFIKIKKCIENSIEETLSIDDLLANFKDICQDKQILCASNPVSFIVLKNAFEGLINEHFTGKKGSATIKDCEKFIKDFKDKKTLNENSHNMKSVKLYYYNICDVCNGRVIGKSYKCKDCHIIVHNKCIPTLKSKCQMSAFDEYSAKFFGVSLYSITSKSQPIPYKLTELFHQIEIIGINTEGIYRVSGKATDAKLLHSLLDTIYDHDLSILSQYGVHVLTTVTKSFFRELPHSIIPDEYTNDILIAASLKHKDAFAKYWAIISYFNTANRIILDHLCSHLARISLNRDKNKMTSSSLSIIFTPCLFKAMEGDNMTYIDTLSSKTKFIQQLIEFKEFFIDKSSEYILGECIIPDSFYESSNS